MHHWTKFFGGILLVTGTTIGAAMLAVPVSTGAAGFLPSLALFVAFWIFMTYTALLFLEVNTWTGQSTNLITMAHATLGKGGSIVCWTAYLFLLYALMTAYIAGSGNILCNLVSNSLNVPIPSGIYCAAVLVFLFALALMRGTAQIDYLNRIFMIGLTVSYILMVGVLTPYVNVDFLAHEEWRYIFSAVSVIATAFGFHIIIPSLYSYLHGDIKALKWTLIIGSFIPLLIYTIWQILALGIIPLEGQDGLLQGYIAGENGATLLSIAIDSPALSLIAKLFSFFAIFTSFIGVALSLCDFLADGLKITRNIKGNLVLLSLTFLPPFVFAFSDPRAFLTALEAAGAFGVVFLLGLMPALMVWRGRYYQDRLSHYKAPGGKITLGLAIAFSLSVIALEIVNKIGWLPTP